MNNLKTTTSSLEQTKLNTSFMTNQPSSGSTSFTTATPAAAALMMGPLLKIFEMVSQLEIQQFEQEEQVNKTTGEAAKAYGSALETSMNLQAEGLSSAAWGQIFMGGIGIAGEVIATGMEWSPSKPLENTETICNNTVKDLETIASGGKIPMSEGTHITEGVDATNRAEKFQNIKRRITNKEALTDEDKDFLNTQALSPNEETDLQKIAQTKAKQAAKATENDSNRVSKNAQRIRNLSQSTGQVAQGLKNLEQANYKKQEAELQMVQQMASYSKETQQSVSSQDQKANDNFEGTKKALLDVVQGLFAVNRVN